jgi:hypothetical protein
MTTTEGNERLMVKFALITAITGQDGSCLADDHYGRK